MTRAGGLVARVADWPLRVRIGSTLIAVGSLLIGLVLVSVVLQLETRSSQRLVTTNYYMALRTSQAYLLRLVDAENAVRGYALSSEPSFLEPVLAGETPVTATIAPQVTAVLPADLVPSAELAQMEERARTWYDDWAQPTIAQTRAGNPPTPAEVETGRQLFARFRASYDTYVSALREGREEASNRLTTFTNLLFAAVVASALIAIVASALLWYLIRRWVAQPIGRLATQVRTVGAGDLGHQVTITGPREFVQLGADVESMRERLVSTIEAVRSAGDQVVSARADLEAQAAELQRSNRELEQFAYVASHDLQEPLRKVASFCQMLQRRYSGQLDERADQYIAFAVDGAKRMQQLINDLLEFSRVGRIGSAFVDVDLDACLQGALFNLQAAREESRAEITAAPLPHVLGEAALLTQLLQNLIGNAIKFRSQEPPRIEVGVTRRGAEWDFSCSDNGIGIEPDYAERVFLIFQRLHPKEVYGGTGIGLAMCKKIVEYHGGRIWVEARTDGGTTMRWTLPAEPRRALTAGPATTAGAATLAGAHS